MLQGVQYRLRKYSNCCFNDVRFDIISILPKTKQITLNQRFSIPVLAPHRSTYFSCLSKLTHLIQIISSLEVRSMNELFRLTCSLHSVHCSLLPEQGKAAEVYFTSEHSFMDLRCATSLRTDECDIIYVCKYIQFKFTSRTLQCTMNGIRSLRTGIMEEYRVMSTSQGTCVRIEQTSEVIRVTYEMCRAVGREDWNWEPLL